MAKKENSEAPKDSAPVRYSMQPLIIKMTMMAIMPMTSMMAMMTMVTMMTMMTMMRMMMTTHPK